MKPSAAEPPVGPGDSGQPEPPRGFGPPEQRERRGQRDQREQHDGSSAAEGTAAGGPVHTARRALRDLRAALTTPAIAGPPPPPRGSGRGRRWAYVSVFGLVAVLVPVTDTVLSQEYGLPGAIAFCLAVAQAGPLLLAVTRPLQAWWIVITADTVGALLLLFSASVDSAWPWPAPAIIGYLVLCLALAVRERRSTLIAVWTVTLLLSFVLGVVGQDRSDGTNVILTVLSGLVLLLAGAVRERGDAQRRLAEQETISEAERARRTLLEERARIARELHDVVAHHMSVVTVQADSAPYRLEGLPPEAREEFASIAETARESLSEMRRLLGVLRSEDAHGERAPQPGLDRLSQLAEATVRAGVPTELSVADGLSGLPQAVQLSVYRIVQEALANVVRHAPGAATRVSVTGTTGASTAQAGTTGTGARAGTTKAGTAKAGTKGEALTVLVVNGPSPGPASPPLETAGTGHGLVGMRERVRLTGGTLDTGPLPDGGFRVVARIPLPPAPPTGKDPTHS
ncbi:sensor histidine kinase [Streptomyces marispadix]|uniref:histidine kinase n=1 Tax=Streptomyces marispadix TaxID=2922868 RepID=A0ABS9SV02_9ACTN|nr:sensor histidine kinase [Streptomyces marispadix]MCH6160111.1 sensor histidine kinase [Streptomyces marispadix]